MKARPNLVLAGAFVVVVALALIAWVFSVNRSSPQLSAATPDGAAQLYVLAIVSGDDGAAVALLDPELGCTAPLLTYVSDRASIAVVDTKSVGDKATVTLDITEYSGGLLDVGSHQETLELRHVDDGWLVTGEPWPLYRCE